MQIVFDEASLARGTGKSRSVTGVVYYDFSGFLFPAERWSDFIAVVVTWWLEALEKMGRGTEQEAVLRFMDGPYFLRLIAISDDIVLVKCVEDRSDAGVVHEEHVSLTDFRAQLQRLARQIAWACKQRGWESTDLDALKSHLPN